ncbi:MAG: HAMP domain-containing protein [Desulfobacter sp.]|nr:HAMP domain-containing protein [Desulfobacter sp.]
MKKKILKSFFVILIVLLVTGSMNLFLFMDINRAAKETAEKRHLFEICVNRGGILIGRIQSNIWDAMVFEDEKRETRVALLDEQALAFFEIIETLEALDSDRQENDSSLMRLFQTFYLSGKEILKHRTISSVDGSAQEIKNFMALKSEVSEKIDLRFSRYMKTYDQAVIDLERRVVAFTLLSFGVTVAGLLISALLSFRLSEKLILPIKNLTLVIGKISTQGPLVLADETTGDEIGALGAAFNRMTAKLRASVLALSKEIEERKEVEKQAQIRLRQLLHADKMASLGTLVAGVAHEINNPNQFIMSNVSPLKRAWEGAVPILDTYGKQSGDFKIGGTRYSILRKKTPQVFDNIIKGSDRIKHFVEELKRFSINRPASCDEIIDINEVINSVLTISTTMVKKHTHNFSWEPGTGLPRVKGDFQQLEQVVINFLQNACQALTRKDQAITITTLRDKGRVIVRIRDQGRGIPKGLKQRITDPFFTTRAETGGTGLGLSISRDIMARHKGGLDFRSDALSGTCVTIDFPCDTI